MEAIVVEARRNGIVEARHRVHAVAVRDGAVVAEAGDAGLVAYLRSASKPIQALPLARARDDLDDRDLAIAAASHRATDDQIAAVRALLAKAPASEDELELGPQAGRPPRSSPGEGHDPGLAPGVSAGKGLRPPDLIYNNCSGKHAGMLALCRARGWDSHGYRLAGHPVQDACRDAHAEAADAGPEELPTAVDGCGIVTFALPLERMAFAYSRFELLPAGARIADAMRAHPDLVGGPDGADFHLMRDASGWFAKGGAEGLLCAGGPDASGVAIGVALKSEDGATRPLGPALAAFLAPFGVELSALREPPILNTLGERVGELAVTTS
jgi:L-asparaginase II